MNKIVYYITDFFRTKVIRYSVSRTKEEVNAKIKELLAPKTNFLFSSADFSGYCHNDHFELNLISGANTRGVKYSSTLTGLIKTEDEKTVIEIQLTRSSTVFGIFFLIPIIGIIMFVAFLNDIKAYQFLFWALILIVGGPFLGIWFSNVSNTTLQERFEIFIKKELS